MRVKEDSGLHSPGGDTAAYLGHQLREAVRRDNGHNGSGRGNGRGNGSDRARRIALEVGAAMLADASQGTAEHSDDVVLITEAIGERMGIAGAEKADLLAAARLHDIGKAWVPPEVLEKPGPLTDSEWELMHQHTLVGERILNSVEELRGVGHLVRHSHERWDGDGYPDGLAGTDIPLGSRIIFCADSFHAIRSDRPYRAGRSAREALDEIKRCAGTQFDPRVARALEQVIRERNRRPRGGGSARLFALLMCLGVLGAGTAIARSGLLPEPSSSSSQPSPPPACGTAACPTVAAPVGGLAAVGGSGPRPLSPGLPGEQHRNGNGHKKNGAKAKSAASRHHQKARGHAYGKSKGAGHSAQSNGNGGSGGAGRSAESNGVGSGGAGSSSSSSSHGSSSGHHARGRHSTRISNGASHGNSGGSNAGGNTAHGK